MVRDRRTGRGPGLAVMLTACDKDCDLAARPKANFIIAAVLSSGLTGGAAWLRYVTPAAGAQVRLVASACFLALLVIVDVTPRRRIQITTGFHHYNMCDAHIFWVPASKKMQMLLKLSRFPLCCESVSDPHL